MGEFDLIRWIRDRAPGNESVRMGIGDDCAVLRHEPFDTLVTTDMLMEGRHFLLNECSPEDVGYKAMAVNLSDVAAMAGVPLAAFVSVALPRANAGEVGRGLQRGLALAADRFRVALAGGDTNAWDGPLVVNVALVGRATERGPVSRSGARPGDAIFVTGPLGGSILGRHLRPNPRVDEALILHENAPLTAMIDISDGIASDLNHILTESGGLGAILDEADAPIHPDALKLSARDGRRPIDHALTDGEDFELAFTLPAEVAGAIRNRASIGSVRVFRVGVVTESPGLRLRGSDGSIAPYLPKGFDHLAPEPQRRES